MKYLNEVWAVIPARSGSKGLKNKNIKKFKNKPLFSHSVRSAINSNQIDKVIFSSDSKKYISLAKRYKCEFYHLRSKKNSRDISTDIEVFKEIVKFFKNRKIYLPEYFVHFRPTSPIRKNRTLDKAIKFFKKNSHSYSSLKSVSFNSHNSLKDYIIKKNRLCSISEKNGFNIDKVNVPRDKLKKTFIGNGVIDIYKTKNILKGKLLGNKVYPFVTEDFFCDIDSKKDFKLAEIIAKKLNGK